MGKEPCKRKTRREGCEKPMDLPCFSVAPQGWPGAHICCCTWHGALREQVWGTSRRERKAVMPPEQRKKHAAAQLKQ